MKSHEYLTSKSRQYGAELPREETGHLKAIKTSVHEADKEGIGEPKRKKWTGAPYIVRE